MHNERAAVGTQNQACDPRIFHLTGSKAFESTQRSNAPRSDWCFGAKRPAFAWKLGRKFVLNPAPNPLLIIPTIN
jgi:hypothetical protein